jgi:uncharacterized glyoxalase superfamily protein PhnB
MADRSTSSVECDQLHPILAVADLAAAIAFYTQKLGFELGFTWGDPPRTAGVNIGQVSVHLRQGRPTPSGLSVYFTVDDVDALHERHVRNGVTVSAPPAVQPWGLREYQVQDVDGYTLTFGQHVPGAGPKIEIERTAISVRLEKRLVALLEDLAAHKQMSVGECLEEALLHTFEKTAPGRVASPHTERTLAHIDELKAKHGIDYDADDAYRFAEKV